MPSLETRTEIARLLASAVKQPRAKQLATWAKAAKLLPKELQAIVGKNSPGWGLIASREVAAVAMELVEYASTKGADYERVERELNRILPDLPMISLSGIVKGKRYIDALARIDRGDPRVWSLVDYLSSS